MYHQALDSSAQTTTATAQMPRPFVRGYDRQEVSRIQGGGVYIKGFSRMEGSGMFDIDWEAEERRRERDAEKKAEKRARMTPEQRARAEEEDRRRERAGERYRNMTEGEKLRENVSAPFRKLGKSFDRSFGKIGKLF